MAASKNQLLSIEPKNELFFKGPFNEIVTSVITLWNPLEVPLAFKVKTTAPKRYCVRPSGGRLEPKDELKVSVMLQPFDYDPAKKDKHKFMIQSVILPPDYSEAEENIEDMWKKIPSNEIKDSRLVCVHRYPGELIVEPSYCLAFDGTTSGASSTSTLSNPSSDPVYFLLESSSDRLSLTPSSGVIQPNSKCTFTASTMESDISWNEHHITLKSMIITSDEPGSKYTFDDSSFSVRLALVYSPYDASPRITEAPKNIRSQNVAGGNPVSHKQELGYLDEIQRLKTENLTLKQSDIALRRAALSDTCARQRGPFVAEGGTALGTIAGIPLILFLILPLIIGLVLGKYIL